MQGVTCDELFESCEFGVVSLDWRGRIVRCVDIAEERGIAGGKSRCDIIIELAVGNNIRSKNKPFIPAISPRKSEGVVRVMAQHDLHIIEFPIFELYSRKIGDKVSVNSRTISKRSIQSGSNSIFICILKHLRGLSS